MSLSTLDPVMEYEPKEESAPKDPLEYFKTYSQPDQVISIQQMRDQLRRDKKPRTSFKTLIQPLDELVDGVQGGELVIVGGKTKQGKTLMCQTLTDNFQRQGIKSLWFEYEVPVRQFAEQMDESLCFYVPGVLGKSDITWMTDRVFESVVKYDVKAVFIDHLHYLIDLTRIRNPSLEIGAVVRKLKLMAVSFDIVIFLVCHVRDVPTGEEVTENHLRDSKLTAAEADTTWIVSRLFDKHTKEATNMARVSVRNHRRTGVMAKSFKLVKVGRYFDLYCEERESEEIK